MAPNPNPLLDAALQYAGRGWRVFPLHNVWFRNATSPRCTCRRGNECPSMGKHPRIQAGFKGATTDRSQIEAWWDKWPQAGIGFATGQGVTVFDFDGSKGRAQLEIFLRELPGIAGTLICRTGNGCHAYFADSAGTRCSAHDGTDVRGEGGYVILPPTVHKSGRQYEWATDSPLLELPEGMREWASGGKAPQRRPSDGLAVGQGGTSLVPGAPPPWIAARQALAREAPGTSAAAAVRLVDSAAIGTPWTAHEEARLRSALGSIPASIDGKTWASIGMALHDLDWVGPQEYIDEGTDICLEIWDDWSRGSQGRGEGLGLYRGREDLEKRWAGFEKRIGSAHGVTVASVYHLAAEHGWNGEVGPVIKGHSVEGLNGHSFAFGQTFGGGGPGSGPIFVDTYKNGDPKPTCVNSRIAIRGLGLTCRYNSFHEKLEVGGQVMRQWAGEFGDKTTHILRGLIHQNFGFDPGSQPTHDAVVQECLDKRYDPVADYLDSLTWDRVPRLGHWMTKYLGAQPSHLNSTIGALGLIAACRRIRAPGAKFDAITVFISDEGHGKSSAVEILAGESNFCDQPILNLDEKAQQEMMQGVWLYEIADLVGMSKSEVDRVKAFASRRIDRARPAYAKNREDRPRRCVFYATTNSQTFLKSQTGNRRFWPVQVGRIRLDELRQDRDQLWAEASELERAGVPLGLPEALWSEAAALQLERMEPDSWDDILAHIKSNEVYETHGHGFKDQGGWKEYRITTQNLFEVHLKISADRQYDGSYKRLAYVMRRLGWDGPKLMRLRGSDVPVRGFSKRCQM